jgi:hypothetical protein
MKVVVLWLLFAWVTSIASLAAQPGHVQHCQSSEDRSCTEANGRIDATALTAEGKLGLMVWGGPAAPQPAMRIILEEYKKAGISVWLTGDVMPSEGEDQYYKGFNRTMEKAIAGKRGADFLPKAQQRMEERIKAAEAIERQKK